MGTADTATRHTTGPITVHPFNNTITRGFELRVTSEGVPDCPIAIAALKADAVLFAAAGDMLAALKSGIESVEQLVRLNRIPANNKGLRDMRAAVALAEGRAIADEPPIVMVDIAKPEASA